MSEQFVFDECRRKECAADLDVRLLPSMRLSMNDRRDQVFSRPCLAVNQDIGIRSGADMDHPLDASNRFRDPDHLVADAEAVAAAGAPVDVDPAVFAPVALLREEPVEGGGGDDHPVAFADIILTEKTNVASIFPGRARPDGDYYIVDYINIVSGW